MDAPSAMVGDGVLKGPGRAPLASRRNHRLTATHCRAGAVDQFPWASCAFTGPRRNHASGPRVVPTRGRPDYAPGGAGTAGGSAPSRDSDTTDPDRRTNDVWVGGRAGVNVFTLVLTPNWGLATDPESDAPAVASDAAGSVDGSVPDRPT